MDILPAQPPGPSRRLPDINRQYAAITLVVIVALVAGYLTFGRGGGGGSAAAGPTSTAPAATISTASCASLDNGSSQPTAPTVLATARCLAIAQSWVHVSGTVGGSDDPSARIDGVIGPQSGYETYASVPGVAPESAQAVQIGSTLYLRADWGYLFLEEGFSRRRALAAANTWLRMEPGDDPHRMLGKLTMSTLFASGLVADPVQIGGMSAVSGTQAVAVEGALAPGAPVGSATLFVAADDPHLPLEYLAPGFEQLNFDQWGQAPADASQLSAPSQSTPYAAAHG